MSRAVARSLSLTLFLAILLAPRIASPAENQFFTSDARGEFTPLGKGKVRKSVSLQFMVTRDQVVSPSITVRAPSGRDVFENRGKVTFTLRCLRDGEEVWKFEDRGSIGETSDHILGTANPRTFEWFPGNGLTASEEVETRVGDVVTLDVTLKKFPKLERDETYRVLTRLHTRGMPAAALAATPAKAMAGGLGNQLIRYSVALTAGAFGHISPESRVPKKLHTALEVPVDLDNADICVTGSELKCDDSNSNCLFRFKAKIKAKVEVLRGEEVIERFNLKMKVGRIESDRRDCTKSLPLEAGDWVLTRYTLKKFAKLAENSQERASVGTNITRYPR